MSDVNRTHILKSQETHILSQFHPAISKWFEEAFDSPTPPQLQGWPAIFNGEHTLILAPTGSGKTLAAFLVCINNLLGKLLTDNMPYGVHTLYISPLKALNYDIERNLEIPLAGIQNKANEIGIKLPLISKAVRTGDTPQKERQRMIQQPPHILITTPESLHLLLTSSRAREILRSVEYVIVDEIHSLSDNKRGTFLSILLERLQHVSESQFIRIGLSATQKPLEEIAKFLGGMNIIKKDENLSFTPRPVTIVDAGIRKEMELQIVSPVKDFKALPEDTIWPDIYQKLLHLLEGHRSTLIFTNNRAAAERITNELNERAGFELARAHHGSVSKEKRREIEDKLKKGELPVLVATATLELGIDMGAIDLVCQVESPKSVARGLQRVGRAGHLYKAASKGRLLPKMRSDLLEMAVITRLMHQGDVAPINIPRNCLDILAQQIVAIVALNPWQVDDLYNLVRQSYSFQDLPRDHFLNVIEMLSGRYPDAAFKELRPRISWDRLNNILYPLPGSQRMAILSGGAIPDTGQYGCYLEDGHTKIGELEEEFVYERRLGEVFVLGTNNWRIKKITHDRVIVSPAPGEAARMPFWKGEYFNRSIHLGKAHGQFCRELSKRLDSPDCLAWLQREYELDYDAAVNLQQFFIDQKTTAGVIPDDQTILMESFYDDMGDLRVVIHSPFGGRLHLPWKLALLTQFRRHWGIEPESYHSDAGILFRFTSHNIDAIIDIIRSVTSQNFEELVISELANSTFFGIRFRHNANRAMLIPRPRPGKRAPLWLQRMRSRDLLEIARQYPSFPIVMETYRESMQDFFAMKELKALLTAIESHEIKIITRKSKAPSPFTASLMFEFMAGYMYQYDEPKSTAGDTGQLDTDLLQQLLQPDTSPQLLDEQAVKDVELRLQGIKEGYQARTATELVELLLRIGDLTEDEIKNRVHGDFDFMINDLVKSKRIVKIHLPEVDEPWRWIATEDYPRYRDAFAIKETWDNKKIIPIDKFYPVEAPSQKMSPVDAQQKILERYLIHHALVSKKQIITRYPIAPQLVQILFERLQQQGDFIELPSSKQQETTGWVFRETLERIRRVTIFLKRSQVHPCDTAQFVEFLLNWQHLTPDSALSGHDGILALIEQFQGLPLPAQIWEDEIFSRRITDYRASMIDEICSSGKVVWHGLTGSGSEWGNIIFNFRDDMPYFRPFYPQLDNAQSTGTAIEKFSAALNKRGACFVNDLSLETGYSPSACAAILWEMIWYGMVTNDTFAVIRAGKPAAKQIDEKSSALSGYPHRSMRRFRSPRRFRPMDSAGRWSLLPPNDQNKIDGELIETLARQLLQRYGLLCREIYELENWSFPWRGIYEKLIQLEWRGEIQRGYFVKGLSGMQFALPQAADQLLSFSKQEKVTSPHQGQIVLLNSCDPANLYGAASPLSLLHPLQADWRLLRNPNNYLIIQNGIPLMAIEAKGNRLTPLRDLTTLEKKSALQLLPRLLDDPAGWRRFRAIKVEYWDGQPVRNSEIISLLKEIGFRDEYKMMILERKF